MDGGGYGLDVHAIEDYNGVRFSWNCWPSSRVEAQRLIVPISCLYTPLKSITEMPPPLVYHPIRCKGTNCGAVLNPYCQLDFRSKLWTCPFCLTRNHFPPHYAENIGKVTAAFVIFPPL
jgi:protein transport protein SEC23